jgi:hypothetical protein
VIEFAYAGARLILIESKNIKPRFRPNCFLGKKRLAKFIPDKSERGPGEEKEEEKRESPASCILLFMFPFCGRKINFLSPRSLYFLSQLNNI